MLPCLEVLRQRLDSGGLDGVDAVEDMLHRLLHRLKHLGSLMLVAPVLVNEAAEQTLDFACTLIQPRGRGQVGCRFPPPANSLLRRRLGKARQLLLGRHDSFD